MIEYYKGAYSLNLLFRIHGSAIYKGAIPGLFSVAIFFMIDVWWRGSDPEPDLEHPYAVGVLVSSVSFIIIFRANYGYQRYWEACGATHHFMSKWLDATVHTATFHMQQSHYNAIKPPSYWDWPDLNKFNLTRDREQENRDMSVSISNLRTDDDGFMPQEVRKVLKSINYVEDTHKRKHAQDSNRKPHTPPEYSHDPLYLLGPGQLDGGWGQLYKDDPTAGPNTYYSAIDESIMRDSKEGWEGFASTKGGRTPALFLQELAHLSSLLCAVAMTTLRNDVEGFESPLDMHIPGADWPEADPDKLPKEQRQDIYSNSWIRKIMRFLFSYDRSPKSRTRYNASRPMPVLGGVSENEIAFLQRAKGPSAKVTLVWMWLSEFIIREHLAGSTGDVGPPIISRLIQFLSDGMIYYNHARKIMYIPFPFPHAQLSAFFILVITFAVPFLMDQYSNERWLGALLTFFTVTCLTGLHEVARELENPFRNVPNDLPLCKLTAMYNESLITMYSGYHPDHFWDGDKFMKEGNARSEKKARLRKASPPTPTTSNSNNINNNGSSNNDDAALKDLHNVVLKQAAEIERLQGLMESKKKTR
eukprot:scaffold21187_cov54-Attheya_sp.AAC.3